MPGEWETVTQSDSGGEWETVTPAQTSAPVQPVAPAPMPGQPDVVDRYIADPTKQTGLETQLQGTAAGVSQVMGDMFDPVAAFISENTPDEVKDYLRQTAENFLSLPNVQSSLEIIKGGNTQVDYWEKQYPRLSKDIKAALDISTLAAGGMVSGKGAYTRMTNDALKDSVRPYMNQANMAEMLNDGRIRPGTTSKVKFVETPEVKQQIAALRTVPGFKPAQTNIKRFALVDDEIKVSGQRMQDRLEGLAKSGRGYVSRPRMDSVLSKKHIKNRFNSSGDKLERSEFMTDKEYQQIVDDVRFGLQSKRADGAIHVSDIHKYRKQLDHRYRNVKGENRAAGKLNESRDERIWRVKRDIMNDIIDRVSPGSKQERARLKTLYDVRETLHQKAFKGEIYYYKDAMNKVPFAGDTAVKIMPRGGR